MKRSILLSVTLLILGFGIPRINAQTASTSDNLVVQPVADRNVAFDLTDPGISKTVEFGPDLAWDDETNFRRAVLFMGIDQVDVARLSFTPLEALIGDTALTTEQIKELQYRIDIVNNYTNTGTTVALNCDHDAPAGSGFDGVDAWYRDYPARWAQLIDQTTKYVQDAGRTVVSVAPFNEPDYGWNQYSAGGDGKAAFYDICGELRNNTRFNDIRISGGNTLNCDEALPWYNYLKDRLDEGNTHQLAGSFDGYANFLQTVAADGNHATLDELHNIVEALVGYEYGMQTGIWWADIDYASGQMVKAFDGQRIGYAEHRNNWTAAAVYRTSEGKVQAFGGTSERQAATTTFSFVSKDRVAYFDGYGPQRVFALTMPGGTGYGQGQTNAERVINITSGEDVQPLVNGTYLLVNRKSGQVVEVAGSANGANIQLATSSASTSQQWKVTPVNSRIGGDFSYYSIISVNTSKSPDVWNWSLEDGGELNQYQSTGGANQQWYLDYNEDGWFYIGSRWSTKCIDVDVDGNIVQWKKNGSESQQWRFLPIDAAVEFDAPSAPESLVATPYAASVKLEWTASSETDVAGYDILRAESAGGEYNTIARNVTATAFVDNSTLEGVTYFYKIKAVDQALNHSAYSGEVSASATGENDLVEYFTFDDDNTLDKTVNLNHGALNGGTFVQGKQGSGALSLNGSSDFVQLPEDIASHSEITIATWVKWAGFSVGQHLVSFSNGAGEYIYLSPSLSGQLEFAIKKDGVEQKLNTSALSANTWVHLVVTLGDEGAVIYLNGDKVAESTGITIRPSDINPMINYIGVNQSTKKFFDGVIDDFRVYNYQFSATEVTALYGDLTTDVFDQIMEESDLSVWPNPANSILHVTYSEFSKRDSATLQLFNMNGSVVTNMNIKPSSNADLDVSNLSSGVYMLQLTTSEGSITKKVIIKH
ncbi:LamG-like jellyroll fold domain-containing protein [Mangrovibacterium lignilyticum]|uniref:LamG-like jellyroll fold domain-containing protein n=1 Tax=Mangrovibacterium lignilyticum TaxID=2668052 RepID=UPI0013D8B2CA|nr:LamG-like jellyroll fold domain-containing protein [Mangrovibacterium lignilyticum]